MWRVYLFIAAGLVCRGLALPWLLLGEVGAPFIRAARYFAGCAWEARREWERRLWARGQHTDLHPPPGA